MNQRRLNFSSTGYFFLATAFCPAATAEDPTLSITIHLSDHSGLKPATLAEARNYAGDVLGKAGVYVQWQNCVAQEHIVLVGPECGVGPEELTHFTVGLLPDRMTRQFALQSQQLGMAISSPQATFAGKAYVFVERVHDLAQNERVSSNPLIGITIAHEIAHLLLGSNSHFPVGIMRAKWRPLEVQQALIGNLIFTPQQAEQIRGDVRRRMKQANVLRASH